MRVPTLLAAFLMALCACDLPSDPVPTNPYDPAFDGDRQATSPDRVALAVSTPTSVTLAWADRSSFEIGFRVERAVQQLYGGDAPYETVAVLPPNTTTYTDATLTDTAPRLYRVTALAAIDGAPSAPLGVRYPTETLALDALAATAPDVQRARFSADGEALYAAGFGNVSVVRTGSGAVQQLGGVNQIAGLLGSDRLALVEVQTGPTATVRTYAGAAVVSQATFVGTSTCSTVIGYSLRVSHDGRTVAGMCGPLAPFGSGLAVWPAGGGTPRFAVPLGHEVDVAVAPDGSRAFVSDLNATPLPGRLSAFDTGTGALLWTRLDAGPGPVVVSPDGTRLLDVSPSGARLLDAATGDIRAGPVASAFARPISFSADGRLVAYATGRGAVVVARAADLVTTIRLEWVLPVAFGLLGGGRAIALRETSFGVYEVVRWDFSRAWEVDAP